MKLYAVTGKDGQILLAYPATQFHNEQSLTLKELHTYDPATQVVVDREVYESILYAFSKTKRYVIQGDYDKFLSAGKEPT